MLAQKPATDPEESSPPTVRLAADADGDRWDSYVRRSNARGFCWYAWRDVLAQSYRVEPVFLLAEDSAGEIVGVAPLYFNRTIRGGRQGFGLRHGLAADGPTAARALYDACLRHSAARGARSLSTTSGLANPLPEAVREVRKTVVLRLRADEGETWQALRRETRVGVKRSRKHGTAVAWGAQHLPAFYEIYARNMLSKNVPIYTLRYFEHILTLLGEGADLLVVLHQERVIAGMIVLWGPDTLDLYIGAWLREFAQQVPYQRMYWEAICEAQRRELSWVDMGESREGSGTFRFKTNFGGEPRDVYYLGAGAGARGGAAENEGESAAESRPAYSLLGRLGRSGLALADRSPLWVKRPIAQWRRRHGRIV